MANSTQRVWLAIPSQNFTATGTNLGLVTLASTANYHVKQLVYVNDPVLPQLCLEVKAVLSSIQLVLGPKGSLEKTQDMSLYTTVSSIYTLRQNRPEIPELEYKRAVYEEEPAMAVRTLSVDSYGNPFTLSNPLPVQLSDGSINIETLNANLVVQITALDNFPKAGDIHDSVRIGDGTNEMIVNPNGSINVVVNNNTTPANTNTLFGHVSAVAAGITTDLLSFTVPVGKIFNLCRIEVSGSNIAEFDVYIDGAVAARKRTWFGSPLDAEFIFETNLLGGLLVAAGQTILIQVTHLRPDLGDFECRILGQITT